MIKLDINEILTHITSGILAVSVFVGIFYFKKIKSIPFRCLIIYLAIGTLVDISLVAFDIPRKILRGVYCISLPIEYIIYVFMFKDHINQNKLVQGFLILSAIGLGVLGIYQITFSLQDKTSATVVFRFMGILTMILVLFYFRELLVTNKIVILMREPLFLIATCLLIFTVNIVPTGFYHLFYLQSKTSAPSIFLLNIILNMVRYGIYSKAFILASKEKNG